jgi:hypothetical protein
VSWDGRHGVGVGVVDAAAVLGDAEALSARGDERGVDRARQRCGSDARVNRQRGGDAATMVGECVKKNGGSLVLGVCAGEAGGPSERSPRRADIRLVGMWPEEHGEWWESCVGPWRDSHRRIRVVLSCGSGVGADHGFREHHAAKVRSGEEYSLRYRTESGNRSSEAPRRTILWRLWPGGGSHPDDTGGERARNGWNRPKTRRSERGRRKDDTAVGRWGELVRGPVRLLETQIQINTSFE